ncbi:tyrosine-protein kinase transmembrane modulator EpsC [Liquorilactobacillus sucicola DSM 21376 = JCM 15457]|uniref:Capsular polysaccharide biosynthesis protein CpsC n=1 Tax=Liquorilactobacillus sucicola DSM 21376 = JCM 15457 TaxID=1423806 RepID=A0A023CWN3_9LACO|nr:Wzz/FepE/Etk N-terminal domain-containing protein [Liquorilactobacillus sucicola]KRN06323.1 Exopolysaccharide chain length regulator [Liquorilactobacillus sucicola DSM 21376 = JCM 15457]GAJ26267.1 tyrosine-protein kinase transmembrane modulator EpsC [Liquorilactobacillus sucicola DSM 21376 = JCM 15457]
MNEEVNGEALIDLSGLVILMRKSFWNIVLLGVTGAVLAMLFSFVFMTPKYNATTDLLVNQKASNQQMQYNMQQADLQVINTYKDILKRDVVLTPVLKQIKRQDNYTGTLNSLRDSISITNQTNSQVLSVTVKDKNAYTATEIANAIGKVFSSRIKKMMKVNNVTIVTRATPQLNPISPNVKLNLLIGIVAGLLLGIVIVVIRDLTDTTVRDEKFLTEELNLTSLGVVNHINDYDNKRHAVSALQDSIVTETRRV